MINTLACKMASFFANRSQFSADERVIFVYGLEIILSSLASVMTAIIISLPFHQFFGTFVYLVLFITIRQLTGGFHADTYKKCYFIFLVVYSVSIAFITLIPAEFIPILVVALSWSSLLPVFLFAPVANKNKNLSGKEKVKFRKISRVTAWLLAVILTVCILILPQYGRMILWGTFALLTTAIFIVVAIIKNGGHKNDKMRAESNEPVQGSGHGGCSDQ